jgi:GTP-binding protein HflX
MQESPPQAGPAVSSSPQDVADREGPARAILVGVDLGQNPHFDESLDELALLAESAGDIAVARVVARRKAPDAAFFVGSGKADELRELVQLHQAEAVLFDQALSPRSSATSSATSASPSPIARC